MQANVGIRCAAQLHVTDVHWNLSRICAQFLYNAQMCITPMQAQVSMLIKHHQLIWKHDADASSPNTASSASTHKPCDQCGLKVSTALSCVEHQCKHNWVTLAAYGDWLHLMIQTL